MKIFEAPEMSVQMFAVEDVITTSTTSGGQSNGNEGGAGPED